MGSNASSNTRSKPKQTKLVEDSRLLHSFNNLNLSDSRSRQPDFVGGFAPEYHSPSATRSSKSSKPPSFPKPQVVPHSLPAPPSNGPPPISMPQPVTSTRQTSLTMKYALEHMSVPSGSPPVLPSLTSAQLAAPPLPATDLRASSVPPPTVSAISVATPLRLRSHSTPPSPTTTADEPNRCKATKRDGSRCTRKRNPSHMSVLDRFQDEDTLPYYCGQHLKMLMERDGFRLSAAGDLYDKTNGTRDGYVKFSDWIPSYVSPPTTVAMQELLLRVPSQNDKPGYIYAFEIRDEDEPDLLSIKVGRTVNLKQRIASWSKQCGGKTQVFRGLWPSRMTVDEDLANFQSANFQPGPPGPHTHLLERLIHLHMADLVVHMQYKHPKFPNVSFEEATGHVSDVSDSNSNVSTSSQSRPRPQGRRSSSGSVTTSPKRMTALKTVQSLSEKCLGCGKAHKEIFTLIRPPNAPMRGREFELIVKPMVMEHWGRYVSECL